MEAADVKGVVWMSGPALPFTGRSRLPTSVPLRDWVAPVCRFW